MCLCFLLVFFSIRRVPDFKKADIKKGSPSPQFSSSPGIQMFWMISFCRFCGCSFRSFTNSMYLCIHFHEHQRN